MQLLFLFKVSLFGTWLVDTLSGTSPMGSVIRAFDGILREAEFDIRRRVRRVREDAPSSARAVRHRRLDAPYKCPKASMM